MKDGMNTIILHPSAFILPTHPLADAGRLPEPGRRGDESQPAPGCQAFVQPLDEARALDPFGRDGRTVQLGRQ